MSLLTGCGNVAYTFPYDVNSSVSSFNVLAGTGAGRAEPFAADLCVVTEDQTGGWQRRHVTGLGRCTVRRKQ